MSKISNSQKNKILRKLKKINITSEKDILNIKVNELKKVNEDDEIENLTIKDIETIWEMQDAINNKCLLDFFTNTE